MSLFKYILIAVALLSKTAFAQFLPNVSTGSQTYTQGTANPTAYEVTQVTTVADVSGSLGGKYFTLNAPNSGTAYYVWIDVDNGSVDPAVAGKTGVEVDIAQDATQGQVGDAVQAAVDALAAFTATDDNGGVVTITAVAKGPATDATAGDSGFAILVTTQGLLSTVAISSSSVLGNLMGWKICNNAVQSSTWLAIGKTTDPETDGVRLKKGACFDCLSCTPQTLRDVKVSSQAATNLYSVVQFKQ